LRRTEWDSYLRWAVESFRIAANGVSDETQIHTHMCYSEFNDIIASIAAMDADVITIETSRSDMELLDAFDHFSYPNEIGPASMTFTAKYSGAGTHRPTDAQSGRTHSHRTLMGESGLRLKNPQLGRSHPRPQKHGDSCKTITPGSVILTSPGSTSLAITAVRLSQRLMRG
jgi:hypothetical protein